MNPDSSRARSLPSMAAGASARARPQKPWRRGGSMADVPSALPLVGLDVGGTMIKGLLLTSSGEILAEESTPTQDDGTTAWRDRAKKVVASLLNRLPSKVLASEGCSGECGIGVAA